MFPDNILYLLMKYICTIHNTGWHHQHGCCDISRLGDCEERKSVVTRMQW